MKETVKIDDMSVFFSIAGPYDRNLSLIEEELGVRLYLTDKGVSIQAKTRSQLNKAKELLNHIISIQDTPLPQDIYQNIQALRGRPLSFSGRGSRLSITVALKGKAVIPKTEGQCSYVGAMRKYDLVFSLGPAGTGKTYLAMAMAVHYLSKSYVGRIILTRPAIEAGESLGFLPGDLQKKLSPYLRPLNDALYDMMHPSLIEENMERGVIEVAPLAFMRGRTLNNAFVILDEAQNCTWEQLKMFLTRLGFNSKIVITGDLTQSDLPGGRPKGLLATIEMLKKLSGVSFVHLTSRDVIRHKLVQDIIKAYENFSKGSYAEKK